MTLKVILSAVDLSLGLKNSIVRKVEFNFEVILYITIFVSLSPGSCFKSAICYQNSILKHTNRHVFAAVEGRKIFSPERFEDSALLNIPF